MRLHMATSDETLCTAWYLVHTKPRQEQIALENLSRQGYCCYLPLLRVQKVRRGKAQVVSEPMFARYLFVQLSTDDNAPSWAPIRSTLGVSQLVRFGTRAARVDDALVHLLRQREQAIPTEPLFQPGETVALTQGPWAGLEAVYQMTDAQERAVVLLTLLSRPVSVTVNAVTLRRAS